MTDEYNNYYQSVNYSKTNFTSTDLFFNLSLQNGVIYKITPKIGIGLTEDIFFYNINSYKDKKNNHLFNLGYGDNSTIINTGLRLQYCF